MQAVLSSGSSQSCPSLPLLGGRGMSWKTNCRHPTVLPRPTSAEFFRDCSFSQCAHHTWVAFCIFFFSSQLGIFAMIIAHRSSRSVRQHQHSALLWFWSNGGSRLRQCGPNADSSLNRQASRSRHVPVTGERLERNKQQTERQTWAAERSSSKAGSESHRRRRNLGDM